MTATVSEMKRPAVWTAGDWNAFFGFGTNTRQHVGAHGCA